jgi:hypothetical protein
MDLTEIRAKGANWIHLVQDKGQWQTLVNKVMNFGFHTRQTISWSDGLPRVSYNISLPIQIPHVFQ